LDVIVRESATIFKLLPSEDQSLLVWGNSLLVLNLGLDIIDSIRRLDLKSDSLARKGFDEAVPSVSVTIRHHRRFVARILEGLHLHWKGQKVSNIFFNSSALQDIKSNNLLIEFVHVVVDED